MDIALFTIVAIFFLVWMVQGFRRAAKAQIRVIRSPRLGILNLASASLRQMVEDDKAALAGHFSSTTESTRTPPACDVLFLYCELGASGEVKDSPSGLREIIRDSGASIVIVASENSGSSCAAAAKRTGYGYANLVLIGDRKGEAFRVFFQRLFDEMEKGVSMPVAWVKLAPQIPGHEHPDGPASLFLCEAGQIAFGSTLSYEG